MITLRKRRLNTWIRRKTDNLSQTKILRETKGYQLKSLAIPHPIQQSLETLGRNIKGVETRAAFALRIICLT